MLPQTRQTRADWRFADQCAEALRMRKEVRRRRAAMNVVDGGGATTPRTGSALQVLKGGVRHG